MTDRPEVTSDTRRESSRPASTSSTVCELPNERRSSRFLTRKAKGKGVVTNDEDEKSEVAGQQLSDKLEEEPEAEIDAEVWELSKRKRWFLLIVFSLSCFLDVSCRSGIVLFTTNIAEDLDIVYESSTWILTSFSVPFACFLLFWGRVADLFSPKLVFVGGFMALGVSCIIVSICPEMISFFVFRGLCGLFCSATIPSAFKLITLVFHDPIERGRAITVFSLTGAIANAAGLILASVFGLVPATSGQMSGWRWYFRFIALIAFPFAIASQLSIPRTKPTSRYTTKEKWRRFDIPGCIILLLATLLFILSLTLGATYGWKTAKFLVPFCLCWPAFAGFGYWETRQEEGYALIPPSTWKIRNVSLLLIISISAFAYWPLPLIERYLTFNHETPILTAARFIPQGLASMLPIWVLPYVPQKWKASRWYIVITYTIIASMLLPLIFSHGETIGAGYWRYYFPSFIIASFFGACSFSGISVSAMISVPEEMSGVAGALLQVFLQVGGAAVFSIQAGLLTIYPGGISNFKNFQVSWWFFAGWYLINAIAVAALFRDPRKGIDNTTQLSALDKVATREEVGIDNRPGITRMQSLV